jgi:hypothetical protein
MTKKQLSKGRAAAVSLRRNAIVLAIGAMLAAGSARAFEVPTGNPDWSVRWDNTIRYNLGWRVESRDQAIGNSIIADEGTYSFDKGDIVQNRLDLLTELDVVYKRMVGFRVSAAGWYDNAYDGHRPRGNPALVVPNLPAVGPFPPLRQALPNGGRFTSYDDDRYSPYTDRFYAGPSGEILDAFVFANFDLGNVATGVKAGRHTLYWGESLLLGGHLHSVSYGQMPLDLQKGFSTPGSEAKELFRPLGNLSLNAQLTNNLSVAAQYFWEWESARYPEGGTFLGPVDFLFNGPDRQIVPAPNTPTPAGPALAFLNLARVNASEPEQHGDWGVAARWSPDWLDGTMGFYYRNYSDKLPQALITSLTPTPIYFNPGTPVGRVVALNGQYRLVYADDIDLLGLSLSKNIAGVSVGAEVSYRRNTPLLSQTLGNVAGVPISAGDTPAARGDTWHALVNAFGTISKTPLFDSAVYMAELIYSHWSKVRSGQNLFQAEGQPNCVNRNLNASDGCATKNFWGLAINFTPTWFQVFPGADLSAPITWSQGLSGNSAVAFGGNEGLGNYSIGLALDYLQKYRFDLKYIDFYGDVKVAPNPLFGGLEAVSQQNGFTALNKDRGAVYLTFKTTF